MKDNQNDNKKTSTFDKITRIVVWVMILAIAAGIIIPVLMGL